MEERKKPLLRLRTLIDLVLGAACIGLLWMMLAQLDALKKIEADIDRLRAQIEAKPNPAPAVDRAPATGPSKQ